MQLKGLNKILKTLRVAGKGEGLNKQPRAPAIAVKKMLLRVSEMRTRCTVLPWCCVKPPNIIERGYIEIIDKNADFHTQIYKIGHPDL